jgi:hypothetical protein
VSEVSAGEIVVAGSCRGVMREFWRTWRGEIAWRRLLGSRTPLFMILCMSVLQNFGHVYDYRLGFSL